MNPTRFTVWCRAKPAVTLRKVTVTLEKAVVTFPKGTAAFPLETAGFASFSTQNRLFGPLRPGIRPNKGLSVGENPL
jgi:hypothetical protein